MDQAGGARAEEAVDRAIARADREWRRMGVVETDRVALRDDLRRELTGAAADGVLPDQLIGTDIGRFARELALSAGVRRAPYEYRRLLLTGLLGGLPGLVVAWFLILRWWWLPLPDSVVVLHVSRYAVSALVFVVGVLIAIDRGMRGDPARGRTVTAMAVLVPVAGVLMIPVTTSFAAFAGYSDAPHVVLVEAAIVAAGLAGAAVLGRRWALAPVLASGGDAAS